MPLATYLERHAERQVDCVARTTANRKTLSSSSANPRRREGAWEQQDRNLHMVRSATRCARSGWRRLSAEVENISDRQH